jgi:signal transduction histidine kinase
LLLILAAGAPGAEPRATPAEARAMAERAAAAIECQGRDRAFAAFEDRRGGFVDREMFVVAMDRTGRVLAHGARPSYVGMNMSDLTDVRGDRFVERMLTLPEDGFLEYFWQNPLTEKIEHKTSYVVVRPDHVLFVGAYASHP